MSIDPTDHSVALLRDAVLIFGGLLFCEGCGREANPQAPDFTDAAHDTQVIEIGRAGWAVSADALVVRCPSCAGKAAKRG